MMYSKKSQPASVRKNLWFEKLTVEQVEQIDALLSSLGEDGELRLIVQRGTLKYINKVESHRTWQDEAYE
jgi:hypothetical protein